MSFFDELKASLEEAVEIKNALKRLPASRATNLLTLRHSAPS